MLKVIGKPHSTCGVVYVEVQYPWGIGTMMQAEVTLRNMLYSKGLTDQEVEDLVQQAQAYAHQLQIESEID